MLVPNVNLRFAKKPNAPAPENRGRCASSTAYCLASSSVRCWLPVFSPWPAWPRDRLKGSEPIQDLVGPEPFEAVQRLVQRRELLVRDAADLLHRLDVLLVERVDDLADFLALR